MIDNMWMILLGKTLIGLSAGIKQSSFGIMMIEYVPEQYLSYIIVAYFFLS